MNKLSRIWGLVKQMRQVLIKYHVLLPYEAYIEMENAYDSIWENVKDEGLNGDKGLITDGFGNYWDKTCSICGDETMQVVRPGKAQCSNCD